MPSVTLTGSIVKINRTEEIGTNGFKKRTFLLAESKDSYPSTWLLETHKDFCATLDNYRAGAVVTCEVEITGRAWTSPDGVAKAFNTLKCYRIAYKDKPAERQPDPYYSAPPPPPTSAPDDLPF